MMKTVLCSSQPWKVIIGVSMSLVYVNASPFVVLNTNFFNQATSFYMHVPAIWLKAIEPLPPCLFRRAIDRIPGSTGFS